MLKKVYGHLQQMNLLQGVTASGKVASGYLEAACTISRKATCSISCKLPKFGESVQTRSLQVD